MMYSCIVLGLGATTSRLDFYKRDGGLESTAYCYNNCVVKSRSA